MVSSNFTLVSGTFNDEQHLLSELDLFIADNIGWAREKVVTDIASDKEIVYSTYGTVSGTYDKCWVKAQATLNVLSFEGMSRFDLNTDTSFDSFGGLNQSCELSTSTSSGTYWFAANLDAVHVLIDRAADSLTLHAGFGHFITYYTSLEDPKPFYVFGQTASLQTFESVTRLQAYGPHSWGASYSPTMSGALADYRASHPTTIQYGTPNPRTGFPKLIEPVLYSIGALGSYEVRGEVPGLFMCGGTNLTSGAVVDIYNMFPTVSGSYLINRHSDVYAWAVGPVTVSGVL